MTAKIILPDLGAEPGAAIVVSFWFSDVGEEVIEGDRLVELLVGDATFDLPAPAEGRLATVLAFEDDVVGVGDILGTIEVAEPIPDSGDLPPNSLA